jgi:integrase
LYNTGARVQEVADLRVEHVDFGIGPRVQLHGKGDKWRQCPLWPETAALLKRLLAETGAASEPTAPVFGHRGQALTRFGIYKLVRRHARVLEQDGQAIRVSPHVFRHSAATSLLESGAGLNVIRAWLGHVSIESTNRYAEITYQMKAEAVRICEPPANAAKRPSNLTSWRRDGDLLNWLQSL